ncbi:hypothetical protein [Xylanimonas oleitrophica]|nr:hypothetical protein [Xylanimonas oleitrophica]
MPALSTVRMPLEEMGRQAVAAAVAPAGDAAWGTPLGTQVVLRESTG